MKLDKCSLFYNIPEEQADKLLSAFSAYKKSFPKGASIIRQGDDVSELSVVLSGSVCAEQTSEAGSAFSVVHRQNGVFGDVLGGSHSKSPVTVITREASELLFIPVRGILSPRFYPAGYGVFLKNFIAEISDKYFALSKRVACLLPGSLRSRIILFLGDAAQAAGSLTFTVPQNRERMAEYLGCDRSALSRELSRMKKAGLIDYYKSAFKLKWRL